jgi:hypothetical protein
MTARDVLDIHDASVTPPIPLGDELTIGAPPVTRLLKAGSEPSVGTYSWRVTPVGNGRGTLSTPASNANRRQLTPLRPGLIEIGLFHLRPATGTAAPYAFEVRLNPALEAATTIVPKDQYDLIMNVLNAFHPIGVEVLTSALRKHVVEVEQNPLKAFPDYTYPEFRD